MKLSDLAKRMVITILIIALICILGSVIYYRSLDFIPFMLGILVGSAVSIAKVFLLERAVNKALTMEKKHAGNYVGIQHILRLFLSGTALVLGALVPQINLWGVAAGILAFQLAIYNVKFTSKKN
ncbi:MAG TPA: hypothetical protein DEB10_08760 [Ruminococcaceae bacterium]|jgi:hypothetical protein|nr:hypothetical protein [Oscillospiraceae bacterium]HCA28277.1 hypothetical protein [Oscillospiraceae bacterium]